MIMVEFLVKIFSISQGSKMDAEYIDPYEINRPINIPEVFILQLHWSKSRNLSQY